jgi:hypothetical protein
MAESAASFATVYARLATARAAASPAERRRFRRAPLTLQGRMMDALGCEHDCRTADISPGDLRVVTGAPVSVGDRIVFYLDAIGRLEGRVVRRINDREFAAILSATPHKREKLADQITFLWSRDELALQEETPARNTPSGRAQITLDQGGVLEGEVVDFSLVGMAIKTSSQRPPLGAWVRVGAIDGRVARHFDGGFAIDFG